MSDEARQFLLTAAWMFMKHGQRWRARSVCEALVEADSRDGVAVAALAEMLLDDGEPQRALEILRTADFPQELSFAVAMLETRALKHSGRGREGAARWRRYLESRKGAARKWMA